MYKFFPATSIALLLTLSACNTSKPTVITVRNGNEAQLNCPELRQEIQTAQHYKQAARSEDRFMLKHINPFTTFFSIYNMSKAESHAQQRIEILEQFYKQRRCDQQQQQTPNAAYPYAPYYQEQQPSNHYYQQPAAGAPTTHITPDYYQQQAPMGAPTESVPQGYYPPQGYGAPTTNTVPMPSAPDYYQQPPLPDMQNGTSPENYYPGGAPYPYNTQN